MKKNITRRLLGILFILLLVITLFSKTFLYWISPKVTVETVATGSLTITGQVLDYAIVSPMTQQVLSPKIMDTPLIVAYVMDALPCEVQAGAVLLRFDEVSVMRAASRAENAYIGALLSLRAFDSAYIQETRDVTKRLDDAQKALAKAKGATEKRRAELEEALASAQLAYDQTVIEGICMGTTRSILERELALCQMQNDEIQKIVENDYCILADKDGYVLTKTDLSAGAEIAGNRLLFSIIPADAAYYIRLTLPDSASDLLTAGQMVNLTHSTRSMETLRREVAFVDSQSPFTVSLECGVGEFSLIKKLKDYSRFAIDSPFYTALVPNSAFISEQTVYVLQEIRKGNALTYIVKTLQVQALPGNERYTPVNQGVAQGMQVITGWDRAISDGMEVIPIWE